MTEAATPLTITEQEIDNITREIKLSIPSQTILEEKKKKLNKIQKTTRVDGFRKGKVPIPVVERIYGGEALAESINTLCWNAWESSVKENELKPLGNPKFDVSEFANGKPIDFTVRYEVMPKIILSDYSDVKVEKQEAAVTEADIKKAIDGILVNHTSWEKVDRPSLKDDAIIINMEYSVQLDDESDSGKQSNKNERIQLNDDFAVPELLPHLIDVKAGDKVNCEASFPNNFPNSAWHNKKANFNIEVLEVQQSKLPELNEDFAHKMGIAKDKENPIEYFREQVSKNLNFELQAAVKKRFRDNLLNQVIEKTEISVPQVVESYYNSMIRKEMVRRYFDAKQLEKYKDSPEDALPADLFTKEANHRAKEALLIESIEQQRDMDVTQEEIRAVAEDFAVQYDDPEEFIKKLLSDRNSSANCKQKAIEDKILSWLESQVQVSEVSKTYEEVMNNDASEDDKKD